MKKIIGILFICLFLVSFASAGIIDEIIDLFIWSEKLDGILNELDIQGMKLIEFDVDGNKYNEIKETKDDIKLETTYRRIGKIIKQDIWITNKQAIEREIDVAMITEINYNEVRWAGDTYKLTSTPIVFGSWEKDGKLIVPNIFMGKENKRINYRDIAEKGGYAIAYEQDKKYYVELKIDDLNLKANEEYYIDPIFTNSTKGFNITTEMPAPRGIAVLNSTTILIADATKDHIFCLNASGSNISTCGFSLLNSGGVGVGLGLSKPSSIVWNGTHLFISDVGSADNITVVDFDGNLLSGQGYNLDTATGGILNSNPSITGMTSNGSSTWLLDFNSERIYEIINKVNQSTKGFDLSADSGVGNARTLTLMDVSFWWARVDVPAFMNHYSALGVNKSDGFDLVIKTGGVSINGLDDYDGNLLYVDDVDMFVYWLEGLPVITLNSPVNNQTTLVQSNTSMSCTAEALGGSLHNVSLLHNGSGTFQIEQTIDLSATGPVEYDALFNFSADLNKGSYNYTCLATDSESVSTYAENRTINKVNILENLLNYNNETIGGSTETFVYNFTTNFDISFINLIYNNSEYLATYNSSGIEYLATRTINVPFVSAEINKTFYWGVKLIGEDEENSTTLNQSLLTISLDNCTTGLELILNFTLRYENNNTFININDVTGEIEVEVDIFPIGSTTAIASFSKIYTAHNPAQVCLNENLTSSSQYIMDVSARYEVTDHVSKFFYLDNGTLNISKVFDAYTSMNINLMDLATADSTSFLFNFFDLDGLPIADSVVHVFRKYVGEGLFREVERAKQDENGDTIVHLIEEDVIYYFLITLNGVHQYTSSTYTALCQDTPCTIQIEASGGFNEFDEDYDLIEGGSASITTDSSEREVTLTYALSSPSEMNLTLYKMISTGEYNVVNSSSETATSGTIALKIPQSAGNVTFFASLEQDGTFIRSRWVDLNPDATAFFGTKMALFLAFIIILTLALMGVTEGAGTIIFVLIGVMLSGFLGLIVTQLSTGIALLTYLILAGGIIIWKLARKD